MITAAQVEQRRENVRMIAARRRAATHCKRNHEFTPANTITRANGHRMCLTCQSDREWYAYHGVEWSP